MTSTVRHCKAMELLESLPADSVDMIYTDPPFGTGDVQVMERRKRGEKVSKMSYIDRFPDYREFLEPHLDEFYRVLKPSGTLYLHLDPRWSHYAKVWADECMGREAFVGEIVWSYNFGGRGRDRWPAKHDVILMYAKDPKRRIFRWDAVDRVPYKAPSLQYLGRTKEEAEKRIALGQVPTDVWTDIPILGTASRERTGYPSQKPVDLVARMIKASTFPGELVVDPFAGSGTTGAAAITLGRKFALADCNPEAIRVMMDRFSAADVTFA